MTIRKIAFVLYCLGTLAACEAEPKTVLSSDFGSAVQRNVAVHVINPQDSLGPAEAPELAGDRAAKAYERLLNRPAGTGGLRSGTVTPMPSPGGTGSGATK